MKSFVFILLCSLCLNAFGEVEPSESYLDFWDVEIGESEFMEFELVNNYPFQVEITNIDLDADFSAFDLNENCLGLLDAGDSCFIEVIFSPYEVESYMGDIDIEVSTGEWITIDLQGEGVR